MKFLFAFAWFSIMLVSCSSETNQKEQESEGASDVVVADTAVSKNLDTLKGLYIGDFDNGPIRISIDFVSEAHAVGFDLHRGIQRNISGKVETKGDRILMSLNEPGDHPFDGVFSLDFDQFGDAAEGTWKANNKKYGSKSFKLKRVFPPKNMPEYNDIKINQINNEVFNYFFFLMSDSLGSIEFQHAGRCIYSYTPNKNENYIDQKEQILGDWNISKGKVMISWEDNSLFESNASALHIIQDEYGDFLLQMGERKLYPSMF